MKDQLFLFTGENEYALSEELRRWQKGFIEKHGEANFQILEGKDCMWSQLLNEVQSAPFLGEKRLVIIEGIPPKITKEEFEMLPTVIHPQTLLAFVESEPDKRKSTTKFLLNEATVKSFPPQTPKQLVAWLKKLAQDHGAALDERVAAHLVAVVGSDQWHLKNELLKLLSYVNAGSMVREKHEARSTKSESSDFDIRISDFSATPPTVKDVDLICIPSEKHTVWKMSDLIGKGDSAGAVHFAALLHKQGEDAFALWNIYLWIMKNLATLWIYQNEKNLSLPALSKESGVPFMSAQALLPLIKKFKKEDMQKLVATVVKADEALKTGGIKATAGEPVELMAMLERQILSLQRS